MIEKNKRVKNASIYGIFNKKYKKFLGEGALLPSQTLPPGGRGIYPSLTPHPPQRIRHLDPSHSKILGTPLKSYTSNFDLYD